MSLSKIATSGAASGFIAKGLNTEMTRREFLQMSGALILAALGIQNLVNVFMKHTNTSSRSLLTSDPAGFGSRKFGQ